MGTNITGIGNANAIGFKSRVTGGAYFPPELKDALVGVWSAYGKSNDSTDRNIIKNKIKDRGGDFIISNAAFKLNSGFGGFVEDFTSWDRIDSSTAEISNDGSKIKCINTTLNVQYLFNSINRDIPSFKVKISNFTKGDITYYYRKEDGIEAFLKINPLSVVNSDKVIELPKSYNTVENGTGGRGGFYSSNINIGVTITQIPSFEGAFVTDGIDDLITSTKTVQEMLGGSNEITVVSMMANLDSRKILCNSNYSNTNGYNVRNTLEPNGVITMLGYTDKNGTTNNLNLIMGDKDSIKLVDKVNFNSDYVFYPAQYYKAYYQVAWYWTFIANRVLTEDEINLVIEKYNLDRPGEIVKPDVYYDIKRQKITNENHSAFDDKLIDYSGNGYDAKLYNFGWKEDSGIGKYETDFTDWKKSFKVTSFDSESIKFTSDVSWVLLYHPSSIGEDIPSFKVRIKLYGKGTLYYNYITQEGKYTNVAVKSEIFETPICYNTKYTGEKGVNVGFTLGVTSGECSGTITQIPEYENALVLDGVDDYGKVTGLPILKDYTVAALRKWLYDDSVTSTQTGSIVSKSKFGSDGAFIFEQTLNKNPSRSSTWCFGLTNSLINNDKLFEESFTYQTKYSYNNNPIQPGTGFDRDSMWLGSVRDNDSRYSKMAIWSLLLFPYSLSEFLLERQIKKARAGTLYPNQVEFRPIIPEDENITRIDYFVVNSGTWIVIKPGDYVDVGARIVFNVYTKLPYKVEKVSSPAFTGMSVRHSTELNIFDVEGYIKDKTPQKIKLTLAVNEDIVQWNPTITSNLLDSFTASSWYLNGWDNTLTEGTWIKKTDRVFFKATFKTELYGLETATFGGAECVVSKADNWSDSTNIWDIRMLGTVGDLSQVFNLDVYELIRFEDIVQPYPSFYEFIDENKNLITWGSKIKIGSTITRIKGFFDSNLLKGLYTISYPKLNGVEASGSKYVVEKSMVFTCTATWIFDNNEPKCVLSPDRLQIPNSSYRILKHIPDISGHGNHGKINNSAYAGASGANGYLQNFSGWTKASGVSSTDSVISSSNNLVAANGWIAYVTSGTVVPTFKVEISGIPINGNLRFEGSDQTLVNGVNTIQGLTTTKVSGFYISNGYDNDWSNLRIEQIGEYEGAYCLDGVDDFVTIPTIVGGKQVLMKVNWQSYAGGVTLYDQRLNLPDYEFAIYNGDRDLDDNPIPAYQGRNNGQTYIDGILNNNIKASELRHITHNITITNELSLGTNNTYPVIGSTRWNTHFAQMSLYDFMLFDNISTDDKIKELNEYIGLSGNIFEFNPPTFTIDLPMAIKNIKVYQGGNEISPGYLYPNKDTEFEVYVSLNDGKYAVDTITVDGVEITKDRVVGEYNIFKFILNGSSEQKIKIHSYEYIMYEDINQPYPVIFKVKDRTTNQIYSWGDRIKIGSSIQLIHGENPNLLPELYSIISYIYEGNSYSYNQLTNLVITVTKTISVSCQKTWKLGSNEPKCILSPKRLKLANSSYKYLGYIPDISGNGNNGVFNNFAFSGMSGANGYTYEYTNTSDFSVLSQYARTINSEKIEFFGYINAVTFYRKNPTYKGKIKIEGLTSAISSGKVQHFQIYTNSKTNTETSVFKTDGVYDIDVTGIGDATNVYFYVLPANTSESGTLDNPITIEQVGNYEGAICFDGIDDYVTIPTLSKGGKQVLMKVNWNTINSIIYDQRGSGGFAIYCSDYNNPSDPITVPAYKGRNAAGTTYIDGIRNEYIIASQLRNVTHNIVEILDTSYAAGNINPIIGKSYLNANYGKMSLYDFVLFDEVSTDEEIKQLNDIIGIEGDYVQKPDYYWDAYGKSNFDADRGYIKDLVSLQQANSLENFNFVYDKMSGYGGYSFKSFNDSQDSWNIRGDGTGVEIISRDGYSMTVKKLVQNLDWQISNNEYRYPTVLNKELPFKCKSNKKVGLIWQLKYKTEGATSDTTVTLINQQLTPNVPLEINLPYKTQDELTELGAVSTSVYYLLYFSNTTLEIGEEYTVEMLPLYPNGLVLDGVDDYSENASIPLLSDYTYIFKRTLLNKKYNSASIFKGSNKQSGGGAFICDYNSVEPDLLTQGFSFGAGLYVDSLNADSIVYGTRGSVNGTKITAGNNTDTEGLTVGKWRAYKEMVFYKLFLYPRTVNMLSINMVKNMMEEDGIIDLTSKLFTDKYTGDFYEMDFNNDFLIGN